MEVIYVAVERIW